MKNKTRIMAVSDLHGDSGLARKLAKQAKDEKVDLVILAGDLTFFDTKPKNIIGPFAKEGKEVLIIPGNHETVATTDLLAETYSNTKSIHGYAITKGDIGIFGAGGGDCIITTRDKEIYALLKKGNEKIKNSKKKIMVTHMHPQNSKAEFSGFEGSKAVRKAIEAFQPDILISGHIHEAGGLQEKIGKTKVIHVARKATIFEI